MNVLLPVTITDSLMLSSNVPENDYSVYSAATTYVVGNRVIVVATHRIYESLQAGNLNHYPPDNLTGVTPWWLEVGATNAWKMFDGVVGQQTSNADSISVDIDTSNVDAVSLINVECAKVVLSVVDDDTSEVVFSESYDAMTNSNVIDLYTYFFAPFFYVRNFGISIPIYSDSTATIELVNNGSTAKCGELVIGNLTYLGCTLFGSSMGLTDYSVKQVDDFGNYSVLQRAFSKRGKFDVTVPNTAFEYVLGVLTDIRSTPVVWLPTTNELLSSPLIVYGFYKDFSIVIQYSTESSCSLEIEGLI